MPLTIILSVGLNPPVLSSRTSLLQSAGDIVVSASSVKEAINLFQTGDFDLIVLCYSIPDKDRERLTCLIRASGSSTPVISISDRSERRDIFSDATLEESNPERLLPAVKKVLIKSAKRYAVRESRGIVRQAVIAAYPLRRQTA